ncbi:MAG: RNA polymerase sigma factor [Planctomycetia bacterium]|jgi:RNA polymerase sigma-70 factor (ECF subfamily)
MDTNSRSDTSDISDEHLLLRFRAAGDPSAFEALVHRYEHMLFGYLRRRLRDSALAEDVFQATFLRLYQKQDSFDAGRKFRPWLFAVATNQALDALRRSRRHRAVDIDRRGSAADGRHALAEMVPAAGSSPGQRLEDAERAARVHAALDELSPAHRSVLTLVYERGAKYREAAELLGIPVGTVKSRIQGALHALRDAGRRFDLQPATLRP